MVQLYNNPPTVPSSIGTQIIDKFYIKKALVELPKKQFFTQLADVKYMPKNYGKEMICYNLLPMLDERNLNDEGIDAAGVTISTANYYVTLPRSVLTVANGTQAAAVTAINANLDSVTAVAGVDGSGGTGLANVTVTGKLTFKVATITQANAIIALNVGASALRGSGNLYGSSKDVGTIATKLPTLNEMGGRVNRVGFKRVTIKGTFANFGFFHEYSKDSVNFDTDAQLIENNTKIALEGAAEASEDALQVDLLNAAGVIRYPGVAVSDATITASTIVSYDDLLRVSIQLDANRCPKSTTVITGSRMVDTRTIPSGRTMFIGSELLPVLRAMKDLHNQPAFIGVEKYADATNVLNGEVGTIDQFRIVVVPEMMRWSGAGAAVGGDTTCYKTGGRFDVFPMLVVGDESFSTIGFQTDGKSTKFNLRHQSPGATLISADPYGKFGFMSIEWYYGFMALRPERIALIKTAAKL